MHVALNTDIVQQTINNIGSVSLGAAKHSGVKQDSALINKSVYTNALTVAMVFIGIIGI